MGGGPQWHCQVQVTQGNESRVLSLTPSERNFCSIKSFLRISGGPRVRWELCNLQQAPSRCSQEEVTLIQTRSMQERKKKRLLKRSCGPPFPCHDRSRAPPPPPPPSTHHPSHHTRILRLLFSGLHAAAPGVVPASFPAGALLPWWWWCPFLIISHNDKTSWWFDLCRKEEAAEEEGLRRGGDCLNDGDGDRTVSVDCVARVGAGQPVCVCVCVSGSSTSAMRQRPLCRRRSDARRPATSSAPRRTDAPGRKREPRVKPRSRHLIGIQFYFEKHPPEDALFRCRTRHRSDRTMKCRCTQPTCCYIIAALLQRHVTKSGFPQNRAGCPPNAASGDLPGPAHCVRFNQGFIHQPSQESNKVTCILFWWASVINRSVYRWSESRLMVIYSWGGALQSFGEEVQYLQYQWGTNSDIT